MALAFSAHDTDDSEFGIGSTRCDVSYVHGKLAAEQTAIAAPTTNEDNKSVFALPEFIDAVFMFLMFPFVLPFY